MSLDPGVTDDESPRPKEQGLAGNASWLVLGQAAAKIASFAFVIVVTRGLDSIAYGEFSFAASFVPLFLILGTWGLDTAMIRVIAREPDRLSPLLASGLAIRFTLGCIALAGAFISGVFMVDGSEAFTTLVVIGIALLVDELTSLLGTVFNAFERAAYYATALLANRTLTTLFALAAVLVGGDIVAVSVMYLVGSVGALVVAGTALRRRFPPVRLRDANRDAIVELLRHGAPLGIAAALNMALFRIDAAMLQVIDGAAAVGVYGIAYRFLDSFLFVAYALGIVAMPRIARSSWSESAASGFNGALAAMLGFYVPLAVGGSFLAPWAVTLLFSDRYANAATAVRWLTAAGLFYGIAYLCRLSLAALGKRRAIVAVAAVTLTFNVATNAWAIPAHGFRGAAAVTFFSEVLEAALLGVVLLRSVDRFRLQRVVWAPVVGGVAMASALVLIRSRGAVAAVVAAMTYAIVAGAAASVVAPDLARAARARVPGLGGGGDPGI